ncbi:Spermidine/putrescine import ATP-binding protein PotA [Pediococcus acidilactici]|uniref:lantibiotic protection ABC transporter ATP-binding subunit n=1 Tax=Pediococcus acidilactici TaxID=1254 RepID=UPI0007EF1E7F|nr:lantibiotic protection ABC transporter ATP-binding subunit [Pediococcus acidilactici]ARW24450.1 Spermidine/putrescine import ATP-binding protein PotA [Pediococcus acidilactici]ARW26486.1 Spermidine/putrescine import ATP-binding protein PotA [Pediococcus acidilactici]ARW28568.1 Spermidine/putrescine import ATP-binding protein PotA [Pediococcus acidilactici]KAF0344830.1 lantibiotic protection ABC transporter ATP-binding subunit [Pediococcus acidilactici]OBR30765.1 Spermidine/putrescine import
MEDLILETRHLSKKFKNEIADNDISLHIKRNTVYGLIGPNGAGKSTLLKMIVQLLAPTEGNIIFDGHPISRKDLDNIGALIEGPALYNNLTAEENLLVHAKLLNIPVSRISEVLEIVDLKKTGKKTAGKFSMGMKQRLGIALALLNNPKLLILDEPTNGLDPFGVKELRDLIAGFPKQGITVILSSHILSEVAQVIDRIGIINRGELLFEGVPDQKESLEDFFTKIVLTKGERYE